MSLTARATSPARRKTWGPWTARSQAPPRPSMVRLISVGHADELVLDLAGLDVRPVVLGPAEDDVLAGEGGDDVVEVLGGDGQAAFLVDLRGELGGDRDVEVGGGQDELGLAVGAEEHVGQDGH